MDISMYVHIPFCLKKCYYCDFVSYPAGGYCTEEYTDALVEEMKLYSGYRLGTIYIGGGTPTCLEEKSLEKIFQEIYRYYDTGNCSEITIEANPGTLSRGKLTTLRDMGVNRLSIGLQSWHDHELRGLGRIHAREDFVRNYLEAREAGFGNINIDLMFSIPGQTLDSWMDTLEEVVSLQPEHISCYSLKIEEGTPFHRMLAEGRLEEVDQDIDREMYCRAVKFLEAKGYGRYEISNFAREGFRCVHNMNYWNNRPYIGLGVAAHSFLDNCRYWNVTDVNDYCLSVKEGRSPRAGKEHIDRGTEIFETVFLKLRTSEGIVFEEFEDRFGVDMRDLYRYQLENLQRQGLLFMGDRSVRLTPYGIDVSNRVFQEFMPPVEAGDKGRQHPDWKG